MKGEGSKWTWTALEDGNTQNRKPVSHILCISVHYNFAHKASTTNLSKSILDDKGFARYIRAVRLTQSPACQMSSSGTAHWCKKAAPALRREWTPEPGKSIFTAFNSLFRYFISTGYVRGTCLALCFNIKTGESGVAAGNSLKCFFNKLAVHKGDPRSISNGH